jgi:NAD+ kinase
MRLTLVTSPRPAPIEFARLLREKASGHGCTVVEPGEPADMVVAIGGDGTVLEAACTALDQAIPLIGFNLGTIGFLAEAEPDQLDETLARLVAGNYRLEERLTVTAVLGDGFETTGLNDVVIEKIDSQRLVVLAVEVDGESFLTHRADGVVIATSTGSSAYAFSAGGPLVHPQIDALLFVPVAPHSLFNRTLMLPPESKIRVTVADDRPVRVSVDGREIGTLEEGGEVQIHRGPDPVRFVRFDHEGFPARVTRKFDLR